MAKTTYEQMQPVAAEFIGTAVLTFALMASVYSGLSVSTAVIAGFTLALLVVLIGGISGAHVNPAVTIGQWSAKKIKTDKAVTYLAAQFSGALAALAGVSYFIEAEMQNLLPAATTQSFWAEALGATVFLFGVAAAMHHKQEGITQALAVGGSLFLGIVFASLGSAAILNPAISLVLANVNGIEWQYLVGPLVGGILGFNLFRYLFTKK